MREPVSYKDLMRVLRSHGFRLDSVPGSHHLFVHEESRTTIMLPANSSSDPAMPSQVAAVRRVLDEKGVLAGEAFDNEVRSGKNGRSGAKR